MRSLPTAPIAGRANFVTVKVDGSSRRLALAEIHAVAAAGNYTTVSLPDGDRLFIRQTMTAWGRILPEAQFVRVHRGLIVNLDAIVRIERNADHSRSLYFQRARAPISIKRRHWPALRVRHDVRQAAIRSALEGVPRLPAVAVLPFVNLSAEPQNDIFCDGMSEELLNALAHVPGLRVAARTSSFFFRGQRVPIPDIGRRLRVDFVVEGSVRKSHNRARITVQLIDATDGLHLSAGSFDRKLSNVAAAQNEIARVIARSLRVQIAKPRPTVAPINPLAHRLTMEGRHYWNLRTPEGFESAAAAFTQALQHDPDHAPAHAGLADVGNIRALYRLADGAVDVRDELARARTAALRALRLDARLAEPHATLGFIAFHQGRLEAGERAFQRAFALNPNYAMGYQFFAWLCCAQGRLERALQVYEKAITLDPLSFINLDRHAAMLALAGRTREALAANERAAALRPDVFVGNLSQRAPLLLALGRRDEAVAAARIVRRLDPTAPYRRTSDADAIHTLHQAGQTAEAGDYAAERLQVLPTDNYLRAFVFAAIGRYDDALPALERVPTIMLPCLYWSTLWEPLRDRRPFQALLARLGRTLEAKRAREQSG